MDQTKTCRECGGRMTQGFIGDANYGETSVAVPRWHPGEPEKSWFGTLKIDKKMSKSVATFRCDRCGALQSYAPNA